MYSLPNFHDNSLNLSRQSPRFDLVNVQQGVGIAPTYGANNSQLGSNVPLSVQSGGGGGGVGMPRVYTYSDANATSLSISNSSSLATAQRYVPGKHGRPSPPPPVHGSTGGGNARQGIASPYQMPTTVPAPSHQLPSSYLMPGAGIGQYGNQPGVPTTGNIVAHRNVPVSTLEGNPGQPPAQAFSQSPQKYLPNQHQHQPPPKPQAQPQEQQQQQQQRQLLLYPPQLYNHPSQATAHPSSAPSSVLSVSSAHNTVAAGSPTASASRATGSPGVSGGTWMMVQGQATPQPLSNARAPPQSSPGTGTSAAPTSSTASPLMMMGPSYMGPYAPPLMMMGMPTGLPATAGVMASKSEGERGGAVTRQDALRADAECRIDRQQLELLQVLVREQVLARPEHKPFAYQPPPLQKNRGNAVLFVGQLNYDVSEPDVQRMFAFYGVVQNVVLFKGTRRAKHTGAGSGSGAVHRGEHGHGEEEKQVVGSSAFVTFASTQEADYAIMTLHGRYCMDTRDKPLQVSYCQKTDIISEFGYRHALKLHAENSANPVPTLPPLSAEAGAVARRLLAEANGANDASV